MLEFTASGVISVSQICFNLMICLDVTSLAAEDERKLRGDVAWKQETRQCPASSNARKGSSNGHRIGLSNDV